jgi:hypothetical protein
LYSGTRQNSGKRLCKEEVVFRNEAESREEAVIKEVVDAKKRQYLARGRFSRK